MGLVVDTNVFILAEKSGGSIDFDRWVHLGEAFISAGTVSGLWAGVFKADSLQRRRRRAGFVEAIEARVPVLPFDGEVARVYARILADLPGGTTVGAHGAMIGATAARFGHAVLTDNVRDFSRLSGVTVIPLR